MTVDQIGSNFIELSWQPPSKPNGKIGYYLYYWKASGDHSTGGSFVLAGSTQYKVVDRLKPFTDYNFNVVAYNLRKNLSGPDYVVYGRTDSAGMSSP